jgi:RNA polymerase sigma-70 factor (ECF subfamily)
VFSAKPEQLRELLGRIASGDQAAFATFYDATSSAVFGMALRLTGDRSRAERVTADVYVAAWACAAEFDATDMEPERWLASLLVRKKRTYSQAARSRSSA